ncbi:hypothetical protein [Corynebacterium sp. H130]|uniref:hypothetical protein n=1 Tax=Corynebacterium sp. H130 TaxID=3133444 RepID=UPI0030B044C1
MREFIAPVIAVAIVAPAPAYAQDIQSLVGGPYSVPAGQTTTIDLGIPVTANYSGGGWQVSSQGSSVTVTAPESGSVSVPVSAQGYNATVTLIAEEGAKVPEVPAIPAIPEASEENPQPSKANNEPDRAEAEQIHLDAKIEGNTIVAKLGLSEAMSLQSKFGGTATEGVKLRYLDVNGKEIKGVKRDINKSARTLTLTYPEGQTPDNPFIMEAVKDGKSIAVVTLTDSSQPAATPTDAAKSPSQPSTMNTKESPTKKYGLYAVAGVLALLLLTGLVTAVTKRR